jgi:hypothetical protein
MNRQDDSSIKAEKENVLEHLVEMYKTRPKETFETELQKTAEQYKGEKGFAEFVGNFRKNLKNLDIKPQEVIKEKSIGGLDYGALNNMCLHFTNKQNLHPDYIQKRLGIANEGLCAIRGDWEIPEDDKNNPRVFYVQGIEAALVRLGLCDKCTYLKKCRYERAQQGHDVGDPSKDLENYENTRSKEDKYKEMYEKFKDSVVLNLDPKILDLDLDDETKKNPTHDYPYDIQKIVFEKAMNTINGASNLDNLKQLRHDKSTAVGQGIAPENLSVVSLNGETSALGIVQKMCDAVQKNNPELFSQLDDIRGFVQYVKDRENIVTLKGGSNNAYMERI